MLQVLRCASENVFVPLTVGGGIRDFTDGNGRRYSSLEVASEYFRSGADKISIGSDAVYAAEEYLRTGVKSGKSSLEQIPRVYGNQIWTSTLQRTILTAGSIVGFPKVGVRKMSYFLVKVVRSVVMRVYGHEFAGALILSCAYT
ncbi:imidazole glycerol phosphate synthase hisHF, chloroplastic-like [Camellia sinensis]|uniref:imidazole glycerol phosphate synthase hisHF, chloroplastic-like n=1 Tax=Camellia sinensis TaxID=4442 RepID=UPI00103577C6|nr:imidazole glycerol phosphate synthase hisHF, chloroplastic-like [Camellia sinensis]XP_028055217.1 imidazole glycerol phosphate synthase hisHF, chloroplastic-like [Camellia sinensis]